jgi:hypothetical protein
MRSATWLANLVRLVARTSSPARPDVHDALYRALTVLYPKDFRDL